MSPVAVRSHGSQQATSVRVQCSQCGMMVKAKNLESHQTKRCKNRDMQARKKLHVKPEPKQQPVYEQRPVKARQPVAVRPWWERNY
ncbi:MAG: hypothetical protein PHX87_06575 [Candidatus Peribacteraceae bacterium]|nr:hypothetical protein [Candidatus Peribacteraceae bacterium]MDD5743054.1 hypothetical protein [Candidatus Peribacteraceae bacterium]